MRIAFFTNTYLPHVGGVANSVESFRQAFEERGHDCLVIAPMFKGAEESDERVLRVQAIKEFNGTDFSVRLPNPLRIAERIREFRPDILHSHHPFLLGDSALRSGRLHGLPVVFTHHTMYERYVHYLPFHGEGMERLAAQLATEYANLTDLVIAPSESIAKILRERGVDVPVRAVPTGIDVEAFAAGNGARGREQLGIPGEVPLLGHVGRLAEEKNLGYLLEAVLGYLERESAAHFLLVGNGEMEAALRERAGRSAAGQRIHWAGKLGGRELADAYAAMDVFAFSSTSETQGMVLAEAMAAGTPVVALDAAGAREVVESGRNGVLVAGDSGEEAFGKALAEALSAVRGKDGDAWRSAARKTAEAFSRGRCAEAVLSIYEDVRQQCGGRKGNHGEEAGADEDEDRPEWNFEGISRRIELEWDLFGRRLAAFFANLSLQNDGKD